MGGVVPCGGTVVEEGLDVVVVAPGCVGGCVVASVAAWWPSAAEWWS